MATIGQSKCLCCNSFFDPDRRSRNRQLYFANSPCRIASSTPNSRVNQPEVLLKPAHEAVTPVPPLRPGAVWPKREFLDIADGMSGGISGPIIRRHSAGLAHIGCQYSVDESSVYLRGRSLGRHRFTDSLQSRPLTNPNQPRNLCALNHSAAVVSAAFVFELSFS